MMAMIILQMLSSRCAGLAPSSIHNQQLAHENTRETKLAATFKTLDGDAFSV